MKSIINKTNFSQLHLFDGLQLESPDVVQVFLQKMF